VIGTNRSPVIRPNLESTEEVAAHGDVLAGLSTEQMNAVIPGQIARLQPIVSTILRAYITKGDEPRLLLPSSCAAAAAIAESYAAVARRLVSYDTGCGVCAR
jgi:hypothetical protein